MTRMFPVSIATACTLGRIDYSENGSNAPSVGTGHTKNAQMSVSTKNTLYALVTIDIK